MEWETVSFVMSGKLRFRILVELKESQKTPSDLKDIIKVPISHISKTLTELEKWELVECLTPERRKTKFFTTTDKGKNILSEISRITSSKTD